VSNALISEFCLDPKLVYLNHASFGAPTAALLDAAQAVRRELERDTAVGLWDGLVSALGDVAEELRPWLGLTGGDLTLVPNSTEANNALAWSLAPGAGRAVALFDAEYESVIRCWQVRAAERGGRVDVLPLPLPTSRSGILEALGRLGAEVETLVVSAVTSTAAVAMPLREISDLCRRRGIRLIVDAAHLVGHAGGVGSGVPGGVDRGAEGAASCAEARLVGGVPGGVDAAAVFGSLHKWLPSPRASGFLWVADDLADAVRPGIVAVLWDAETLTERFSWWGTWDPAACLTVGAGLRAVREWERAGLIAAARTLADHLSEALTDLGLVPTGEPSLVSPRLRAFLLPRGLPAASLGQALRGAGIRAWTGQSPQGTGILRFSTNIYNDPADATRLAAAVQDWMASAS
jgi:selenocysteine lyase/cysteine desulfurase